MLASTPQTGPIPLVPSSLEASIYLDNYRLAAEIDPSSDDFSDNFGNCFNHLCSTPGLFWFRDLTSDTADLILLSTTFLTMAISMPIFC